MKQVAGLQAVNAEGKVIGTLSVDDLTELVSAKIIQESKNEAVSARSASVMSEASTLAATDEYEDQLELDTNPAYVRSLDSEGNPKRTATASLATVVGGLLPIFIFNSNRYSGDLNSINETGVTVLTIGCTNCPNGVDGLASFVMNLVWDIDASFQLLFDTNNVELYMRRKYTQVWGDWKKIAIVS